MMLPKSNPGAVVLVADDDDVEGSRVAVALTVVDVEPATVDEAVEDKLRESIFSPLIGLIGLEFQSPKLIGASAPPPR
ncbi:hypothetical protein HDU67_000547 [Dinochytrium kinnereticum]|nr:hypothetical protein HDU67_000547 [Dinochytrium kinnereticum]